MVDCKQHNTDYSTKLNKPIVQKLGNEVRVWTSKTKCVIYKQLTINFKLT